MTVASEPISMLDRLSLLSRQQRLFRLVVPVSTVVFLGLIPVAGGELHLVPSGLIVMLSVVPALIPDSGAAMFVTLALGGMWAFSMPTTLSVWVLVAALDLLALHLACALASYGPPSLVLDRRLLVVWGRRAAVIAVVTALVWVATRLLSGLDLPSTGWAYGAALAVLLGWLALLTARVSERE